MLRLIIVMFLLITVSGCGNYETAPTSSNKYPGYVYAINVTSPEGRKIPCVIWSGGNQNGGITCDWNGR